jgi:hypothetical protein
MRTHTVLLDRQVTNVNDIKTRNHSSELSCVGLTESVRALDKVVVEGGVVCSALP